jgi:hypothetical protein
MDSKRKRKAPDRLDLGFEAASRFGLEEIAIAISKRQRSSDYEGDPFVDVDIDNPPPEERDFDLDKTFVYSHPVDFSRHIDEFSERYWRNNIDPISENFNMIRTLTMTPVKISLHGPVFKDKEEYFAVINSTVKDESAIVMPLQCGLLLSSGHIPIKVRFKLPQTTETKTKVRSAYGYIFSLERFGDGEYRVSSLGRSLFLVENMKPSDFTLVEFQNADYGEAKTIRAKLNQLRIALPEEKYDYIVAKRAEAS